MIRPTDTLCPVCQVVFQQPVRKQGGGRRSIYCSHRCASLDWVRNHPVSRKAHVLKYDNKPESKEAKAKRNRRRRLAKYGLTEDNYVTMVSKQGGRCAGCNQKKELVVDHDHSTGVVRGLLCADCNWLLGHSRDNRATLYQLCAYLELDRSKPLVYVIGSLQNDNIPVLGLFLREAGFDVMDNWWAVGKIADKTWQEYSAGQGKNYEQALRSREAEHTFYFDCSYLNLCDAAVLLWPGGRSAHMELGYVRGLGKPAYILMEEQPERFDVMTQFASGLFANKEDLLAELRKLK